MSARKLAVQLLDRTEQEKSYSNLLLDHALAQSTLEERDKRLCASLYYGVIERRITLDAVLSHYCKQPLRKLDGTVRNILRLGIYQLLYCDQIPARAAVDASVKLTRSCRKASASGFVNAVLRSFLRDDCRIPLPKQPEKAMAVEYAVPEVAAEKAAGRLWQGADTGIFGGCASAGSPIHPAQSGKMYAGGTGAGAGRAHHTGGASAGCLPAARRRYPASAGISAGLVLCAGSRLADLFSCHWRKSRRNGAGSLRCSRRKDLHHGTANAGQRKGARL